MGWDDIKGRTLADVAARLTKDALAHHVIENAVVDHRLPQDERVIANHRIWWVAEVDEDFPATFVAARRLIFVALIREYPGGDFYYKPMSELDGPFYIDCPVEFLDVAAYPPDSQVAIEWRDRIMDRDERLRDMRKRAEASRIERNRKERERQAAKKAAGCPRNRNRRRR